MSIGVEVNTRLAPPASGAPSETDTLFLLVKSGSGANLAPTELRSTADFVSAYGVRVTPSGSSNGYGYDSADGFFREGGRRIIAIKYTGASGATLADALAALPASLGPGQIAAPYETPGSATFTALHDHAVLTNRYALYDVNLGDDTAAEITTVAGGLPANDEYGLLTYPWGNIPAPAGVVGGSARKAPASAIAAALIARSDALGNPNRAAAGRDFPLQYVTGFDWLPTDDERNTLLGLGANGFANKQGVLQLYGFQTALAENADNPFWQANAGRARMWLKARALGAGENYMFKPIDGRGRLTGRLKTDLDAICLELWLVDGLYGETPADAFATEAGATLNTVNGIAHGELRGLVEAKFSMHTKRVLIDLVSVPITGQVSQAV